MDERFKGPGELTKPVVIGITGGISTGKSTFSDFLRGFLDAKFFDADQAARQLVGGDAEVKELLRQRFGTGIFSATGNLNRAALRAIVVANEEKKRALEQILHPRIRRQWAAAADESRKTGELFLADIPLLYETQGEKLCDRVVVVACSPEIQQQRLRARMQLSASDARDMISLQLSLTEKIRRADHVVWNNGPRDALERQAEMLAQSWR